MAPGSEVQRPAAENTPDAVTNDSAERNSEPTPGWHRPPCACGADLHI
jgi:hypothetical protein